MKVSLEGARETIEKFGDSKTTWVGPIQGGLFDDLVRTSTRACSGPGSRCSRWAAPSR